MSFCVSLLWYIRFGNELWKARRRGPREKKAFCVIPSLRFHGGGSKRRRHLRHDDETFFVVPSNFWRLKQLQMV